MNWIKNLLTIFGSLVTAVILIDIIAFLFLPREMVPFNGFGHFALYDTEFSRKPTVLRLRDYYSPDPANGFDLTVNANKQIHVFADSTIEVFTNDLGCWDKNNRLDFVDSERYTYFAGDSFTWCHANYKTIFPTVYEKTGRLVAKCGMPHTRQLQQFQKFQKFLTSVNRMPAEVFVGYYLNDPANDYSHPHSSVYRGVRYDHVEIDVSGDRVTKDVETIHRAIDEELIIASKVGFEDNNLRTEFDQMLVQNVKAFLKAYSISANLIHGLLKNWPAVESGIYTVNDKFSFELGYEESPFTSKSREVIKKWNDHSLIHGYDLTFILIPPATNFINPSFYKSLKEFLSRHNVKSMDLSVLFRLDILFPRDHFIGLWMVI